MSHEQLQPFDNERNQQLEELKRDVRAIFTQGGNIQATRDNIRFSEQRIKNIVGGSIEKTFLMSTNARHPNEKVAVMYIIPQNTLEYYYDESGNRKDLSKKEEKVFGEVVRLMQDSVDSLSPQELFSIAGFLEELAKEPQQSDSEQHL